MKTLVVRLPDGAQATRRTWCDYRFAVCILSRDGHWSAYRWSTREELARQEARACSRRGYRVQVRPVTEAPAHGRRRAVEPRVQCFQVMYADVLDAHIAEVHRQFKPVAVDVTSCEGHSIVRV